LLSFLAQMCTVLLEELEGFSIAVCPVPDKINTVTRRGIGLHGQQKEELYARVQTESGVRKHAA